MRGTELKLSHFLLLAACLGVSSALCLEWDKKLEFRPAGRDIFRAQSSEENEEEEQAYAPTEVRLESGVSQKISRSGENFTARYNFINFDKDRISITFGMTADEYNRYLADYGYTDAEITALRDWREKARAAAWKTATAVPGRTEDRKAAGERAVAAVETDYDTRLRALFLSRGFALRAGNTVECDMPVIVKRNVKIMQTLALALQKIAVEKGYDSEELIGTVLSLVQTAIRYKIPPAVENGMHTGGLLPPARALLSGWGDCDTKTALLAAILGNWNTAKMVGVAVPGHYLMAIRRLPGKGDMFVRHEGLEYVLLEPAGPAWLEPGQVSRTTTALLGGGEGYQIEPFFN
ncbi:MAG: hypothetical protein NTY45_03785 [Elusimicrobia bacterium]|nr:hypothetical protein [Elusimicrobiota bacterium]